MERIKIVIKSIIKRLFPIHTKEILIVLGLLLLLFIVQLFEEEDGQIVSSIKRPSYFKGDEDVTLFYQEKEEGINKEAITFRIDKYGLLDKEVDKYLDYVEQNIDTNIKSQYSDYEEISGPINLDERFEECKISYTLAPENLINSEGWFNYKEWEEEEIIKVNYTIEFEDKQVKGSQNIQIKKESFKKDYIQKYIEYKLLYDFNIMNESYEGNELVLPTDVVFYNKNSPSFAYLIILWLLIVSSCSMITYYELGHRKANIYVKRKIELTYFVNSFTLLYQTGMTMQKSFLITLENRLLVLNKEEIIYSDLSKIKAVMDSDQKFEEVLKVFAELFDMRECLRFKRLLLQTLKQGDDHLVEQLDYMTRIMWEERIRTARKESEKASSKLVFPMLLIFIVILIISIVPTFLEVKSIF